jgi:lipid-A-disaccharide synthase-like uncharacterized protein
VNFTLWTAVGMVGQCIFGSRFLVQWLVSERSRRSVIPKAFWYLSIAGSMVLLSYAIHRRDPVFIVGEIGGFLIYVRNLVLLKKTAQAAQPSPLSTT